MNSQKDQLNKLGSLRFAKDTSQRLTDFYSDDELGEDVDPSTLSSVRNKNKNSIPTTKKQLSPDMQDVLWNLRHSASDHIPGKLSLCIGLPVMIRNNDATELCITKGQEGHVVGWKSGVGSRGQVVLDTLFVKLYRPAKNINIEGLPENVVPLTKIKRSVKCTFPNGISIPVRRSQVHVLPNFAMTVYSSQGKTRPNNVVILNSCRDHLSYYTALSRSSTAEGTVIVHGFNPSKITCGASGYLRQEFRELELMDEISKLRFEDRLPSAVNGHVRNPLIRQYQYFKGELYVPDIVPDVLKWSKSDPMKILDVQTDTSWQLIERFKEKSVKYVPAVGTVGINNVSSVKRKADEAFNNVSKRRRTNLNFSSQNVDVGLIWDSHDYSCAYDALFAILGDIWVYNPTMWSREFGTMSTFANHLGMGFQKVSLKKKDLEDARNNVRKMLHQKDPIAFSYGHSGVDISEILVRMFTGKAIGNIVFNCTNCGASLNSPSKLTSLYTINKKKYTTIQEHIDAASNKPKQCNRCDSNMSRIYKYKTSPCFRAISLTSESQEVEISKSLTLSTNTDVVVLPIRGLIYYYGVHFVVRIISPDGKVWYHDGIETKRQCVREGYLADFTEASLNFQGSKTCVGVVYAL